MQFECTAGILMLVSETDVFGAFFICSKGVIKMLKNTEMANRIMDLACRVRELREISGFSQEEMAAKTDVSLEEYVDLEKGLEDIPFSFIHKCAVAFGVDITDLLEGSSARLSSYTVTRRGGGHITAKEDGIEIKTLLLCSCIK